MAIGAAYTLVGVGGDLREGAGRPVRSRGAARGSASLWSMNALIAPAFPRIVAYTQTLPFVYFSGCRVLQFSVVLAIFSETRGEELESMDKALDSSKGA